MNKSSILIYCSTSINKDAIQEILWGIEEEEIPYSLNFTNLNIIPKEIYTNSSLEVGICINNNGDIFLNSRKYQGEYIFKKTIYNNSLSLRTFGNNSARLVKGLYFK